MAFENLNKDALIREIKTMENLIVSLPYKDVATKLQKFTFSNDELHQQTDVQLKCIYEEFKSFLQKYKKNPAYIDTDLAFDLLMGKKIPANFLAQRKRSEIDAPNNKEHYDQLKKKYDEICKLDLEKGQLIINLKKELDEKNKSLGEKERNTLYKLIAAMAYAKYDYDPAAKGPVPQRLSNEVTRYLGTTISLGTVRTWLGKACDEYPKAKK